MNDASELAGLRRYPLARRSLMMTSLMSGFTLATSRVDAQVIHTDTTGLDSGEAQIPVKDGHLPAYYARPARGTHFPAILVNEEVFGDQPRPAPGNASGAAASAAAPEADANAAGTIAGRRQALRSARIRRDWPPGIDGGTARWVTGLRSWVRVRSAAMPARTWFRRART